MTTSWSDVTTIKTEEEFNGASEDGSGAILDMDSCFSELFPDLAVAEAGIIM